jgi:dTDP-4-dehydrorhamnose 3,5-epimerase
LRRIFHPQGDIFHALKAREPSFCGFGEAYFSTIHSRSIKGWKKHLHMTLNLVVPVGAIRFVLIDDRKPSILGGEILLGTETLEKEIGKSIYARLTIPPGVWMAFQGCASSLNLLLNLADIEHDPQEAVSTELATFAWPWQF